ncbi:GatB/YqeY domain-containing protein [Candidatus Nomurabacteria bacterium]|nr:GatB/YqeY domain-containing protein [Candidatus Nomurabacteria bacterium]
MLHENIKSEMKQAMLAKEAVRLGVIRGLLSAFTNELVSQKKRPDEMLDDESALAVIRREAKKRKDSISQFETGGRSDLAESEKAELKFIEVYLPQLMGRDEIKKLAEAKKTELAITGRADAGKLMNALMKDLKGKADGADVKAAVDEILL